MIPAPPFEFEIIPSKIKTRNNVDIIYGSTMFSFSPPSFSSNDDLPKTHRL